MNKYFITDHIGPVWHDGKAWQRVGTNNTNTPNATLNAANGDAVYATTPPTYTTADAQGRTLYTAVEMLLATHLYADSVPGIIQSSWTTVVASVPVDGVMRIRLDANAAYLRINGIQLGESLVAPPYTEESSMPLNVLAGDLVEASNVYEGVSNTIYYKIIPFQYTHPA